ncbi:MAG: cytochrome c [Opitutaceae bacterium]|nr:cytochrome c [Opitutaceae bacterium]
MNKRHLLSSASLLFLLSTAGIQAASVTENWENHCAKCHGADGKAQTKIGKKLKIRDYTDPAVQAKMTDEEIIKGIEEGYKDESGKERMKPFKGELSPEEIKELAAHVRKFKA